jgi:hypothetical protein
MIIMVVKMEISDVLDAKCEGRGVAKDGFFPGFSLENCE